MTRIRLPPRTSAGQAEHGLVHADVCMVVADRLDDMVEMCKEPSITIMPS